VRVCGGAGWVTIGSTRQRTGHSVRFLSGAGRYTVARRSPRAFGCALSRRKRLFFQRTRHGQRSEDYAAGVRGWHLLGSEACEEKGSSCEPDAADCSSPVPYADASNLCLQRRDAGGVKMAEPPQPHKGRVRGWSRPNVGKRCPQGTRRRGGRYGSLVSLVLELGNSHTACTSCGRTQKCQCAGGRTEVA